MVEKLRLLVAATPAGLVRSRQALVEDFDLIEAYTLGDAVAAVTGVDAILCSIHFDHSQLFELLRERRHLAPDKPFVACQLIPSVLSTETVLAMVQAAQSAGCLAFLNFHAMLEQLGEQPARDQFRAELLRLVGREDQPFVKR